MRVVFDTNVLVSALALPGGRADEAIRRIVQGVDTLLISREIIRELLGVLARKFGRDSEQLARAALFMAELAELVEPTETISILTDEADNRILECAEAGSAELIVTGDRAMLEFAMYEGTPIWSLRSYLERQE